MGKAQKIAGESECPRKTL